MLSFSGAESRQFLQGQLSCDTEKLAVGEWVWGGYLNPKGRLLAAFVTLALAEDRIGLLMDASLLPEVLAKFRMYLLRAKTKPEEIDLSWAGALDDADAPANGKIAIGGAEGEEIGIGFGDGMALYCGAQASEAKKEEPARQKWLGHCARLGYPWFDSSLQNELTVHNASLDLIGGVNFDKGCYIGQEIVIRTHHRGAIKARLFIAEGEDAPPADGMAITSSAHGGQQVGSVLYAAAAGNGFIAAVSIRKDAAKTASIADSQVPLRVVEPPYGLIDPKFEKQ